MGRLHPINLLFLDSKYEKDDLFAAFFDMVLVHGPGVNDFWQSKNPPCPQLLHNFIFLLQGVLFLASSSMQLTLGRDVKDWDFP